MGLAPRATDSPTTLAGWDRLVRESFTRRELLPPITTTIKPVTISNPKILSHLIAGNVVAYLAPPGRYNGKGGNSARAPRGKEDEAARYDGKGVGCYYSQRWQWCLRPRYHIPHDQNPLAFHGPNPSHYEADSLTDQNENRRHPCQ